MNFLISQELGNKLYEYLATRPFAEVETLIAGLRMLQPAVVEQAPVQQPAQAAPVQEEAAPAENSSGVDAA